MKFLSLNLRRFSDLVLVLLVFVAGSQLPSKAFAQAASWDDAISGAEHQAGYFDFYYKPATGQLLLKVARWNEDFLYANALLVTLRPELLALSPDILSIIPPKPPGYGRNRESSPLRTSLGVDFATIAETAADHTIAGILQAEQLDGADSVTDSAWKAHYQMARDEIENRLKRGAESSLLSATLPMPPGAAT